MRALHAGCLVIVVVFLHGCGSGGSRYTAHPHYKVGAPYQVNGRWYHPQPVTSYEARGIASWYGEAFHGRPTANGEIYDMYRLTAAHPTLPLPSVVRVTNLDNGRSLLVRVNDRGPFVNDRLIDLSKAAARQLGFEYRGLAPVHVSYLGPARLEDAVTWVASGRGGERAIRMASAR
ncbi:MAG TPA: septal ring lytic transglycosylase RlpA family protein [Geminicoccaceae bacterium]